MSKKAVLVVSYGTSFADSMEKSIGGIERAIAAAFPDREVRRALTAPYVIKKLRKDGIAVDTPDEALDRLATEGFDDIVVQSTHVMNGGMYDSVAESVRAHRDKFENVALGLPLLTYEADFNAVAEAALKEFGPKDDKTALVLMGHGTDHFASTSYSQLHLKFQYGGHRNVYVTTVEGFPTFRDTVADLRGKGYAKVVLVPLLVVAGAHASRDMAGDKEGSLADIVRKEGYEVECVVKGLGENETFQQLFVDHAKAAKPL